MTQVYVLDLIIVLKIKQNKQTNKKTRTQQEEQQQWYFPESCYPHSKCEAARGRVV